MDELTLFQMAYVVTNICSNQEEKFKDINCRWTWVDCEAAHQLLIENEVKRIEYYNKKDAYRKAGAFEGEYWK